jgi:LDH2 family malate/lactate/ureidoglycolate dehydrogenase
VKVPIKELKRVTRQAILHYGYTSDEADVILDVLMYAQLRGNNQGIIKLIGAGMLKDPDAGEVEAVRETPLSALLDGAGNHGMVVLDLATGMAVEKAREHGVGIVGTHNTSTSTGAIGYFARQVAEAGLIGCVLAGSSLFVAMHGSYESIFGTNPVAIGIPNGESPLVLDMATAAIAYYGLLEAKTAGEAIPDNVAYDLDGNPATDPARALEGAIRSFDRGYKGAALSMMIEVLTGPLVGASFVGIGEPRSNWGNLVCALDPELLVDADTFEEQIGLFVTRLKGVKRLPDVEEVLVPGERGDRILQQAMDAGAIEVEDNLWAELNRVVESSA